MESLVIIPLGNHCWVCWWKKFEIRSISIKVMVMGKSKVSFFFTRVVVCKCCEQSVHCVCCIACWYCVTLAHWPCAHYVFVDLFAGFLVLLFCVNIIGWHHQWNTINIVFIIDKVHNKMWSRHLCLNMACDHILCEFLSQIWFVSKTCWSKIHKKYQNTQVCTWLYLAELKQVGLE